MGNPELAAVFVDFENISIALINQFGARTDKAQEQAANIIHALIEEFGKTNLVAIRQAFADWSQYPDVLQDLYVMGVQTENVKSLAHKNSADIELSLSAQETMLTRSDVSKIIIIAGDRDYMPLATRMLRKGKDFLFVGFEECFSGDLRQLVGESHYAYVTEKGQLITMSIRANVGQAVPAEKAEEVKVESAEPEEEGKEGGEEGEEQEQGQEAEAKEEEEDISFITPEVEHKATVAVIESFDEYSPKYGSVRISGFISDRLATALPTCDFQERWILMRYLTKKGRITVETRGGDWSSFQVFILNEEDPYVKQLRAELKRE